MLLLNFVNIILLIPEKICSNLSCVRIRVTDGQSCDYCRRKGSGFPKNFEGLGHSLSYISPNILGRTFLATVLETHNLYPKKRVCLGVMSGKAFPICLQIQKSEISDISHARRLHTQLTPSVFVYISVWNQ